MIASRVSRKDLGWLYCFFPSPHIHNRRRIWLSSWLPALLGEKTILPFSSYVRRPPGARGGRRPRREDGKRECLLFLLLLRFVRQKGPSSSFSFGTGRRSRGKRRGGGGRRRRREGFSCLRHRFLFSKAKTLELPDRYRNAHCQIFL